MKVIDQALVTSFAPSTGLQKGISMPLGYEPKEYGEHAYENQNVTSDCKHGCGCSAGPVRSSGPTGLDPLGICPKNPKDGKLLGGTKDYEYVVNDRIENLGTMLHIAHERLRQVAPGEILLAEEIAKLRAQLIQRNWAIQKVRDAIKDCPA